MTETWMAAVNMERLLVKDKVGFGKEADTPVETGQNPPSDVLGLVQNWCQRASLWLCGQGYSGQRGGEVDK